MKVSLSQFEDLAEDRQGTSMPIGALRTACEVITGTGSFAALNENTRFVRLATDTALHCAINGDESGTNDEFFPANSVEFFAVEGGQTISIQAA